MDLIDVENHRMTDSTREMLEVSIATTSEIRAGFPALSRVHRETPVAYMDGPGGTQVPRAVVDGISDYLFHHNANTHWSFPTSAETDDAIVHARQAMGDFLNAASDEIVFGNNMTTLTFHLARSLGRRLGPNDAIVVTELDHHANIDPWRALERERGVTILQARMIPETGELDWNDLDRCLSDHRTRLLAIGAASNALGTITDVSRAVAMASEAGTLSFVDAVHYAPHQLVNARAWGCDFLACSAYKFYGPHVGVLYGKHGRLEELEVPKLQPAPDNAPDRVETGTQNHEGIVGASAAIDFLASLAEPSVDATLPTRRQRLQAVYDVLHERSQALVRQLWDGLGKIPGVTRYGPPPTAARTPTVAFTVKSVPSVEVCRHLAHRAIFASHGNFYAMTVAARLGLARDGLVRIGCACYTTDEEIDRVVQGIRAVAASVS
jgi:cysteine desulfurase family protein (TIGR01976 family)